MLMNTFAKDIFRELDSYTEKTTLSPLNFIESYLAVKELKRILSHLLDNHSDLADDGQTIVFYNFLIKRRSRFSCSTPYQNSQADHICQYIAEQLQRQAKILPSLQAAAYLRTSSLDKDEQEGYGFLRTKLLAEITTRNQLIEFLLLLNECDNMNAWQDYCDQIPLQDLIKIFTNGKEKLEDVLESKNDLKDELYQRAFSFCKIYIYLKTREAGTSYNSTAGWFGSFFVKVPSLDQKTSAAQVTLHFLMNNENSLDDFYYHVNDPQGVLRAHRNALIEPKSNLQKITQELLMFSNTKNLSETDLIKIDLATARL